MAANAPSDSTDSGDAGRKPAGLVKLRNGRADDPNRINGVGPKVDKMINSIGLWHFDQVAAWSAEDVDWVDSHLDGFRGRVTRDEWVKQAKVLVEGA